MNFATVRESRDSATAGVPNDAWAHTQAAVQDDLNYKRIIAAVDSQLATKGLTRVQEGGMADVLVAYGAGFEKDLQINGSSSGWGALCIAAVGRAPRGPRRSLQARWWLRWLIRRRSQSSGAA